MLEDEAKLPATDMTVFNQLGCGCGDCDYCLQGMSKDTLKKKIVELEEDIEYQKLQGCGYSLTYLVPLLYRYKERLK